MKQYLTKLALRLFWQRIRRHVAVFALIILLVSTLHLSRWHRLDHTSSP